MFHMKMQMLETKPKLQYTKVAAAVFKKSSKIFFILKVAQHAWQKKPCLKTKTYQKHHRNP